MYYMVGFLIRLWCCKNSPKWSPTGLKIVLSVFKWLLCKVLVMQYFWPVRVPTTKLLKIDALCKYYWAAIRAIWELDFQVSFSNTSIHTPWLIQRVVASYTKFFSRTKFILPAVFPLINEKKLLLLC